MPSNNDNSPGTNTTQPETPNAPEEPTQVERDRVGPPDIDQAESESLVRERPGPPDIDE